MRGADAKMAATAHRRGGILRLVTRRRFLTAAAALTTGCAGRGMSASAPEGGESHVRGPAVDQFWRYARHDYFTGLVIDTQTDRVSAVGQVIEVASTSDSGNGRPAVNGSWGGPWLQQYLGASRTSGPLPSEMQAPWGMVLVDPHWDEIQLYERPIPLWPMELRPGWSVTINTQYKTPESPDELPWQLTMHAHRWEPIAVPAGRFLTLRYTNLINFRFTNVSERVAAQRQENIWFAPEIGRWVARESIGTFYQDVGERFHETSYRSELLEWK